MHFGHGSVPAPSRAGHRCRQRHRPRRRAPPARLGMARRRSRSAESRSGARVFQGLAQRGAHRGRRDGRRHGRPRHHRPDGKIRPARRARRQCRHHAAGAAAEAHARRLAPRHRRQPHGHLPVRARRREAAARRQGRHRHHRVHPRPDVGAGHRSLCGLQGRPGGADARARHQPRARRARQLRQSGLDQDDGLWRPAAQGSRPASGRARRPAAGHRRNRRLPARRHALRLRHGGELCCRWWHDAKNDLHRMIATVAFLCVNASPFAKAPQLDRWQGLPYLTLRNPKKPGYPSNPDVASRLQRRCVMVLAIGDTAPDFEAETTEGKIRFHDWIGDKWVVLFSHPKDFTPVCTTELGYMAKIKPEFDKRGVKIIGLSVDPLEQHSGWANDIKETQGFAPNYPMIGDVDFNVSKLYGMLPASTSGDPLKRTPADNQTVRNVFVIGPDKKIKLVLVYPMTTGRNFDEVLRVIDSLQLTAKHKVATPVNWKHGEDVIIAGSVSDEDAKKQYPQGWKAPKPYIRIVPQPKS